MTQRNETGTRSSASTPLATSWDGYAARSVCGVGVKALTHDGVVKVEMIAKPASSA